MWKYVLKRLGWMVITMLCVAVLIFTIMWFVPGDPAQIILGAGTSQADIDALREQMGLNRPFLVQLGEYMVDTFLKFDLGTSYVYHVPVIEEFMLRLPRTLGLGLMSILISSSIGIPMGVQAALHRNKWQDQGTLLMSMVFISIPQFWLALEMIVLFALKLDWLPVSGIGGIEYWVMPVIANSIGHIAMNARQTRSAVLETIRADFVTTARAKGLQEKKVIWKHMMPNALVPIINMLGQSFGAVVGGTVVIETVFAFPGIGTYMLTGIQGRDYPVIRSCVLILAVFAALIVLGTDLVYAYLDPRIKAQYVSLGNGKSKKGGKA